MICCNSKGFFFSHFFSHFQSSVKNAVHVSLNIFVSKSIALKTAVPVLIHDICSEMFLFFLISQKFTRPLKQQPIPLRSTCPQFEYLQLSTETFTFLVSLFKNLVRFLHRKHSTVCSVLNYTAFSFWANSKATKRYILFFFPIMEAHEKSNTLNPVIIYPVLWEARNSQLH